MVAHLPVCLRCRVTAVPFANRLRKTNRRLGKQSHRNQRVSIEQAAGEGYRELTALVSTERCYPLLLRRLLLLRLRILLLHPLVRCSTNQQAGARRGDEAGR